MLTENDVIEAVCNHLEQNRNRIISRCSTDERGIDIVAEHPENGRIVVEAKGETSADTGSKRYGKPFDSAQVRDHVANAVYTALQLHGKGDTVAIALPDTSLHRQRVGDLMKALTTLGIRVYLVAADRNVTLL